MKIMRMFAPVLFVLLSLPCAYAQEKQTPETPTTPTTASPVSNALGVETPLKLQLVISEYDGAQKLSSLPYTIYAVQNGQHSGAGSASLRLGIKVPVSTGSSGEFSYMDVGTNIDCRVLPQREVSRYHLSLTVNRSSISTPSGGEWKQGDPSAAAHPLLRSFFDTFDLILRDGQTLEGTSAVDPVTGHVLKIEVTLNVLK